jgi:hypothetical protein
VARPQQGFALLIKDNQDKIKVKKSASAHSDGRVLRKGKIGGLRQEILSEQNHNLISVKYAGGGLHSVMPQGKNMKVYG